jgi:hypothetical protein
MKREWIESSVIVMLEKWLRKTSASMALSRSSMARTASSITEDGELGSVGSLFSFFANGLVGVGKSLEFAISSKASLIARDSS